MSASRNERPIVLLAVAVGVVLGGGVVMAVDATAVGWHVVFGVALACLLVALGAIYR